MTRDSKSDEPIPHSQRVTDAIAAYVPKEGTAAQRERLLPTVRDDVLDAAPAAVKSAIRMVYVLFRLYLWASLRGLLPDQPRRVLTWPIIDAWVTDDLDGISTLSKAGYRSIARNATREINPDGVPDRLELPARDSVRPHFTDTDINEIGDAAWTLAPKRRDQVLAVLFSGLGGGLHAGEYKVAYGNAVQRDSCGRVYLDVPDSSSGPGRRIYIRDTWADELLVVAERLGDLPFAPTYIKSESDGIDALKRSMKNRNAPRLCSYRLKARWYLDLLNDGVPIDVIADAAGIVTLGQIEKYLPEVDERDPDEALNLLIGRTDEQ